MYLVDKGDEVMIRTRQSLSSDTPVDTKFSWVLRRTLYVSNSTRSHLPVPGLKRVVVDDPVKYTVPPTLYVVLVSPSVKGLDCRIMSRVDVSVPLSFVTRSLSLINFSVIY